MTLTHYPQRPPARRRMRLNIQIDTFLQILKGMDGKRRIETVGLPTDARCVGATIDHLNFNTVTLWIESEQFAELPDGYMAPELDVTFREFYGDAIPEDATPLPSAVSGPSY